jgi:hypothetical protein
MPFPNEHAARQASPSRYTRFTSGALSGAPAGVRAIFGVRPNGKSEIQSLRFDRSKWTVDRARTWLKNHGFKSRIEPASPEKSEKSDAPVSKRSTFWGGVL